jgi:hypothetical protein
MSTYIDDRKSWQRRLVTLLPRKESVVRSLLIAVLQ